MSSGRTECGLPGGSGVFEGLQLVLRGGSAAERDRRMAVLAEELRGDFRVLLQRGESWPALCEAGNREPVFQTLETGTAGTTWQRSGPRDHGSPLAEWDSVEIVIRGETETDAAGAAWFALCPGLPGNGSRLETSDPDGDVAVIRDWLANGMPHAPLFGLVLAGGHSRRMGRDKSMLEYGGLPQWQRAMNLLRGFCGEVFLSARPGQESPAGIPCLTDRFLDFGPIGGLLTALHSRPGTAWLVLACDLPLVDSAVLQRLVEGRRPLAPATAYADPATGLPEPLCAIWEPRMRARLHRFLAEGIHCPRKALIRSPIAVLDLQPVDALLNINTPGDLEEARKRLEERP